MHLLSLEIFGIFYIDAPRKQKKFIVAPPRHLRSGGLDLNPSLMGSHHKMEQLKPSGGPIGRLQSKWGHIYSDSTSVTQLTVKCVGFESERENRVCLLKATLLLATRTCLQMCEISLVINIQVET